MNTLQKLPADSGLLNFQQLEKLQEAALSLWESDEASAAKLGAALIAVRDAMGFGKFAEWYRDNKLEHNRVYYCIRKVEGKIVPKEKPEPPPENETGEVPAPPVAVKVAPNRMT